MNEPTGSALDILRASAVGADTSATSLAGQRYVCCICGFFTDIFTRPPDASLPISAHVLTPALPDRDSDPEFTKQASPVPNIPDPAGTVAPTSEVIGGGPSGEIEGMKNTTFSDDLAGAKEHFLVPAMTARSTSRCVYIPDSRSC